MKETDPATAEASQGYPDKAILNVTFDQLKAELHKHKKDEGPFVLGSQVSYGDFIIASFFESVERVDKAVYDRLVGYDDSFKRLHEGCRPWLERDE